MSIADVTNRFGPPGSAVRVGEDKLMLTYMFPFEARQVRGPYRTGFGIDVKDGHVVRWSPITGMTGNPASAGGSQGSFGEHSFPIFLAADCLSKLVNTVESQGIILIVSDEDASKLRELTENNFGKRLLIVCRNRVIAAPAISAPLASRQLMFTVKNSAVLDSLRSQ